MILFDFVPKIIIVHNLSLVPSNLGWNAGGFIWCTGMEGTSVSYSNNGLYMVFSKQSNGIQYYINNMMYGDATAQANELDRIYYYVALG